MPINPLYCVEHRDKKGFTPLILAATAGHDKVVEILLESNADIEAQSERTKDTPLSLACSGGRYEVVEILLSKNANKEHRNVSDYTPLSLAASGGYVNIIKLLLAHGAEINSRTGSKLGISPLMLAAMNGHTAAVKLLLDMGSDINAQIETNRNTALTLACFQGRHEVVSLLLDRRANVEHRAKTGLTPLMEAASGGYIEVGRVLLDKGADVNASPVPTSRDTALTIAADKGHYRFVELLLTRGAQADARNKKGNSSLWLAANGGHLDVVQLLYSAGADIDSQDNRKVSCLMAAFRKGHSKVVKWMVKHVAQFPSDTELTRFIATIGPADKDLLKKCHQCMDIIRVAKDRQAAEAAKNASNLLEELDRESKLEQSKKEAAARKREKKERKKLEKQGKMADETKEKEGDDKSEDEAEDSEEKEKTPEADSKADNNNEGDSGIDANSQGSAASAGSTHAADKEEKKAATLSATVNSGGASPSSSAVIVNSDAAAAAAAGDKKRSKNKKNKGKGKDDLPAASSEPEQPKKSTQQASPQPQQPQPPPPKQPEPETLRVPSTPESHSVSVVTANVSPSEQGRGKNSRNRRGGTATAAETSPNASSSNASNNKKQGNKDKQNSKQGQQQQVGPERGRSEQMALIPGAVGVSGNEQAGWKEVVRKSKKVSVPANAISRVIGRGGCNINAIRELSGAHIEVEKQSKSGAADRTILIKGSAESTRQANAWIQAVISCPDKDLADIIGKQQFKALQLQAAAGGGSGSSAAAGGLIVGQSIAGQGNASAASAASSANKQQASQAKVAGSNASTSKTDKSGRQQQQQQQSSKVTASSSPAFVNGQPSGSLAKQGPATKSTSFAAVAGGSASASGPPPVAATSEPPSSYGMIAAGGPPKSQQPQQQQAPGPNAQQQSGGGKNSSKAPGSGGSGGKDATGVSGGDPKDYSPFKMPVQAPAAVPAAAANAAATSGRQETTGKDFSPFQFNWGAPTPGVGVMGGGASSDGPGLPPVVGAADIGDQQQQSYDISKAPGYRSSTASTSAAASGWGVPPGQPPQPIGVVSPPSSNNKPSGDQYLGGGSEQERCNSAPGTPISPPAVAPQVAPIGPPPPSSAAASSKSTMSPVGSEPDQYRSPSVTSNLLSGFQPGAGRSMTPDGEIDLRGIGQIGAGRSGARPSSVTGMENKAFGASLQQPPQPAPILPPNSVSSNAISSSRAPGFGAIPSSSSVATSHVSSSSSLLQENVFNAASQLAAFGDYTSSVGQGFQPHSAGAPGGPSASDFGGFSSGLMSSAAPGGNRFTSNPPPGPPPNIFPPPPQQQQQPPAREYLHGSTPNSDYLRANRLGGGGSGGGPPSRNAPPQMADYGQFGGVGSGSNRNSTFDSYSSSTNILNNQSINSLLGGSDLLSISGRSLQELSQMIGGGPTSGGAGASGGMRGGGGAAANELSSALSNLSFANNDNSGGPSSRFSRPIGAERHRGGAGGVYGPGGGSGAAGSSSMMRPPLPNLSGGSPWDGPMYPGGGGGGGGDSSNAPDLTNGLSGGGFPPSLSGQTLDQLINGDYASSAGSPAIGMSPNVTPSKDGYADYMAMQAPGSGGKKLHGGPMGYGDTSTARKNLVSTGLRILTTAQINYLSLILFRTNSSGRKSGRIKKESLLSNSDPTMK